jgi:hypothetical protein
LGHSRWRRRRSSGLLLTCNRWRSSWRPSSTPDSGPRRAVRAWRWGSRRHCRLPCRAVGIRGLLSHRYRWATSLGSSSCCTQILWRTDPCSRRRIRILTAAITWYRVIIEEGSTRCCNNAERRGYCTRTGIACAVVMRVLLEMSYSCTTPEPLGVGWMQLGIVYHGSSTTSILHVLRRCYVASGVGMLRIMLRVVTGNLLRRVAAGWVRGGGSRVGVVVICSLSLTGCGMLGTHRGCPCPLGLTLVRITWRQRIYELVRTHSDTRNFLLYNLQELLPGLPLWFLEV